MSKENKDRPFIPIDDDFKIVRGHGTSVNLIETVELIKELKRISDELVKLEDLYKALDKLERAGGN